MTLQAGDWGKKLPPMMLSFPLPGLSGSGTLPPESMQGLQMRLQAERPWGRGGAMGNRKGPQQDCIHCGLQWQETRQDGFSLWLFFSFLHFPNSLKMNPRDSKLEKL